MVGSCVIECAGEGPSPSGRVADLRRSQKLPKKAAGCQDGAIGQQCRRMEISPGIEAAGERPCANSWVVDFRAGAIGIIAARNLYLAIVQQGRCMTIRPLSVGAAGEGPGSCRRIVEFRGRATATPGDQHFAVAEQVGRMRRACLIKGTGVTPCSGGWIIELRTRDVVVTYVRAPGHEHLAIPKQGSGVRAAPRLETAGGRPNSRRRIIQFRRRGVHIIAPGHKNSPIR